MQENVSILHYALGENVSLLRLVLAFGMFEALDTQLQMPRCGKKGYLPEVGAFELSQRNNDTWDTETMSGG